MRSRVALIVVAAVVDGCAPISPGLLPKFYSYWQRDGVGPMGTPAQYTLNSLRSVARAVTSIRHPTKIFTMHVSAMWTRSADSSTAKTETEWARLLKVGMLIWSF
jgi:hypothetical protein